MKEKVFVNMKNRRRKEDRTIVSFPLPLLHPLCGGSDLALVDFGGEPQRVEGLSEVLLSRGNVHEHQGLGIASQGTLEQMGQLRVAVGDVRILKNKKK